MSSNRTLTWILRGLGLLLMFIGLRLIFGPLEVLADVIPFVGSLVGAGVSFISFLASLGLSLATIAVAWIYYRPLLGILLLAATIGLFVWMGRSLKKGSEKIPASSPLKA